MNKSLRKIKKIFFWWKLFITLIFVPYEHPILRSNIYVATNDHFTTYETKVVILNRYNNVFYYNKITSLSSEVSGNSCPQIWMLRWLKSAEMGMTSASGLRSCQLAWCYQLGGEQFLTLHVPFRIQCETIAPDILSFLAIATSR